MSIHLIVDGYNLIRQSPALSAIELGDFQKAREALLADLAKYRNIRGHRVTVVFDGWKGGNAHETHDHVNGVRVVYSRLGENADEVIMRMVDREGERAVIVTSDGDIAAFASRKKAAVIPAQAFERKLIEAILTSDKGSDEDDEPAAHGKKGAARRPSKSQRTSEAKLKKL